MSGEDGAGKTRMRGFAILAFIPAVCWLAGISCGPSEKARSTGEEPPAINTLTAGEEAQGWILLFDGKTFEGWRGLGRDWIPKGHWIIEEGAIKKVPAADVPLQADGQPLEGGDLMTVRKFRDFELYLEWKISPGGNSGVKYNVSEEMSTAYPPAHAALGFEYQILDDAQHPDARVGPHRTAAALYDIVEPHNKVFNPVGTYNSARIIFHGRHGEHWLNGVKVLEYDLGTPEMERRIAASKFRDIPGFSEKREGHIVLQDHTDAVWFRNIKIRILEPRERPQERDGRGGKTDPRPH